MKLLISRIFCAALFVSAYISADPLHDWVKNSKYNNIKIFDAKVKEYSTKIKKKIDFDMRDNEGKTPLMLAVIAGHDQIVIYLIEKGADASLPDKRHQTALDYAKAAQRLAKKELAEKYVQQIIPALLNKTKINGQTLLTQTIKKGVSQSAIDIIDLLGRGINKPNAQGQTPLHVAVLRGDENTTSKLLKQCAIQVNAQDNTGNTPLHYAAARGDLQLVMALTGAGASATIKNSDGKLPRNIIGSQSEEVISNEEKKAIIKQLEEIEINPINIKIAQQDCENSSAAHATCAAGSTDQKCIDERKKKQEATVKEQEGTALRQFDQSGASLLTSAACQGHLDNVIKILDIGAKINAFDGNGNTALLAAIKCYKMPINGYNHLAVIEYLLKHGASVLMHDSVGKNPLHYAIESERKFITELLFQSLSGNTEEFEIINSQDRNGDTALHYAVAVTDYDLVKKLLDNGAQTDIENRAGKIPADLIGTKESTSENVRKNAQANHKKIRHLLGQVNGVTGSATVHKSSATAALTPTVSKPIVPPAPAPSAPLSTISEESPFSGFDQPFK